LVYYAQFLGDFIADVVLEEDAIVFHAYEWCLIAVCMCKLVIKAPGILEATRCISRWCLVEFEVLKIYLKTNQHLRAQVHEDLNESTVVIWQVVADWKLQGKVSKSQIGLDVVVLLQIELAVVLCLSLQHVSGLLVRHVRMVAAARAAQGWWPIQTSNG